MTKDDSKTAKILSTIAGGIVYTPLVIIGLTVLYGIGYGIWYYRRNGEFPPSYQYAGSTFLMILKKILLPIKWLAQFLWWLIPITPGLRTRFNNYMFPGAPANDPRLYLPMGAWAQRNLTRTLLLLFITAFITITSLVYKFGYPDTISGYSQILNYILLGVGIIGVIAMFVSFNQTIMTTGFDNNPWPMGGADLEERRRRWVSGTAGTYLYYSIAVGLALGILFALFYFVANYGLFSITGTTIMMILSGLGGIYLIYRMLSQNATVQRNLRGSRFLSNLFYIVFIIPCLFGDTVKYLFNQFRHTPRTVYMFLGAEIVAITLYIVLPMLKRYIYTLMPSKDDKEIIINNKIQSLEKNKIIIKERIKQIKNFTYGTPQGGSGENKATPIIPEGKIIDNKGWKNIISNNLNNPANETGLTNLLIGYGYISMDMCKENPMEVDNEDCSKDMNTAIKYIQTYTTELVGLQAKLTEANETLKTLKEEKKRVNQLEKSKILLNDPVYLKNKKYISNFEEQRRDQFDIEYNYNYALSGWFFFRANALKTVAQTDNYKSILNYGDKPNIMYSSIDNKLKIKMNNGRNKKPKIFVIDDVPLQKWVNIVVNYDSGILDVFMDSKLLASFNSIVPYMSQDQITIGDIDGVSGGVCNVVYFPQSISKDRIDINYKILSNKNPPVI